MTSDELKAGSEKDAITFTAELEDAKQANSSGSPLVTCHSSLPFKPGLALFEEGARALAHVLGGEEAREEFGLELEGLAYGQARAARDGFEAGAHGERRGSFNDGARERLGFRRQPFGRDDAVDEPLLERRRRVDHLAGQQHLERVFSADAA